MRKTLYSVILPFLFAAPLVAQSLKACPSCTTHSAQEIVSPSDHACCQKTQKIAASHTNTDCAACLDQAYPLPNASETQLQTQTNPIFTGVNTIAHAPRVTITKTYRLVSLPKAQGDPVFLLQKKFLL